MIRDFFLLLLVVTVFELGLKLALVYWNFQHEDVAETRIAAERLAADIKDIMLNSGGPVAARTVYPILERNHEKLGHEIAIIPSGETISSMEKVFDFTPLGVPPAWSEGRHQSATVTLRAEPFCTSCHVDVGVGQPLGRVEVRTYLTDRVSHWWEEVRFAGLLGMSKVFVHTIILFFLLRARMQPLLALRSVVSALARGGSDLSHRAAVRSHDEFAELAHDLNLFLDRLVQIIVDLNDVLHRVTTINHRFTQVNRQLDRQFRGFRTQITQMMRALFERRSQRRESRADGLDGPRERPEPNLHPERTERTGGIDALGVELTALLQTSDAFGHYLNEMGTLEEHMESVSQSGEQLTARLLGRTAVMPTRPRTETEEDDRGHVGAHQKVKKSGPLVDGGA
jgi:hypothetical protein